MKCIPCYCRFHTAERTVLHIDQYSDVYKAASCYMVDHTVVECTADDKEVDICDACRTSGKLVCRRRMDYCKAYCTVCVHSAAGSGLGMVDTILRMSPAYKHRQ